MRSRQKSTQYQKLLQYLHIVIKFYIVFLTLLYVCIQQGIFIFLSNTYIPDTFILMLNNCKFVIHYLITVTHFAKILALNLSFKQLKKIFFSL